MKHVKNKPPPDLGEPLFFDLNPINITVPLKSKKVL